MQLKSSSGSSSEAPACAEELPPAMDSVSGPVSTNVQKDGGTWSAMHSAAVLLHVPGALHCTQNGKASPQTDDTGTSTSCSHTDRQIISPKAFMEIKAIGSNVLDSDSHCGAGVEQSGLR